MNFKITFQWYDSDVFCTNICIADSEEAVREHYAKNHNNIISIRAAKDYEIEEAKRKGMPIIFIKR